MSSRRLRKLQMSPQFMESVLQGKMRDAEVDEAPADLAVVGCWWDHNPPSVWLLVESETFEQVTEGAGAPVWMPVFRAKAEDAA